MTLLDQLRILRIPGFVKFLLAIVALTLVAFNVYIIYRGLQSQDYDFWIAAGASLLAAVAPALAVVVVLLVTESGMSALKRRMQQMLAVEIPGELRYTFEAPSPRLETDCKPANLRTRPNPARVECGMYRSELWANYVLKGRAQDGSAQIVRLRVELVMRRVNINVVLPRQTAAKRFGLDPKADLAAFGAKFREAFDHTIHGAEAAGYSFNALPLRRIGESGEELAFVAARSIEAEFVWDPSARLEFIQDLVLMIRAFANEGAETGVFAVETAA